MGAIEMQRNDERDLMRKAKAYIEEFFRGETSGHDVWHSLRVYNLAMKMSV